VQLTYSSQEILASHPYAQPHRVGAVTLHGGFDAAGDYHTPRTLNRWRAVEAWEAQVKSWGWPLVEVSPKILGAEIYPSLAQQEMLLASGFGHILWNALTWTGMTEAKAAPLISIAIPDLQAIIDEDLSSTLTGHLGKGLLVAHGMDEAGDPATPDLGAHDVMWFAARDLAFGADAFPIPEPLEGMFRPVRREMPRLAPEVEYFIKYMMNVLMLEVRAEAFFDYCCTLFERGENFPLRREPADLAAKLVGRIATDELIHIAYLRVFVSELRGFTFRTLDGQPVKGAALIDPVWRKMVDWHANFERKYAEVRREQAEAQILSAPGGHREKVLRRFREMEPAHRLAHVATPA